jgi:hypothetical protein
MFRPSWLAAAAALATATPAAAQTVAYDNTGTFQGFNVISNAAQTQGSNTITAVLADDITFVPGSAGQTVTAVTVAAASHNGTAVTVRPFLRFWNADGTGGGPGTYFSPGGTPLDIDLGPTTLAASGTPNLLRIELGANSFPIPAAEKLWVGIGFDDANGTTGATFNQMHNLGYNLYDPPAVGSSADIMFVTGGFGSWLGFNNPPGSMFDLGDNIVANAGYKFEVSPVPEPTGVLAVGLAATVGYGACRRGSIRRTPA